MPLYGLRNAKSYACNPPQFDLKKLFQKNLKKKKTNCKTVRFRVIFCNVSKGLKS